MSDRPGRTDRPRRSPITLLRRRWRKLIARGIRKLGGGQSLQRIRSDRRPTETARLGTLADPATVYDPVAAGEPMPDGFRQVHERDMIVPVYEPRIVPADRVEWGDAYLVIGLEIGDEVRAYPVRLLDKREMVLDELGGVPIVVTWCPACGTGMVHRREVGGTAIVLGNQGALFGNAMTWWDHDTGSVWSQPTATCIGGPRKGAHLDLIPSTLTTWGSWRKRHPATDVLFAPSKAHHHDLADLAIVAAANGNAVGFPITELRTVAVANACLDEEPIAAVIDPADPSAWNVFSRRLGERTVTLDVDNGVIVDQETHSEWDVDSGVARTGRLAGRRLQKLPAATTRPAEFKTHWPGGTLWRRVEPAGVDCGAR